MSLIRPSQPERTTTISPIESTTAFLENEGLNIPDSPDVVTEKMCQPLSSILYPGVGQEWFTN